MSTGELKFITPAFMAELSGTHFARMPDGTKMNLYFKHRKVAVVSKNYDKLEMNTAGYWDNYVDLKTSEGWNSIQQLKSY